MDSLISFTNHQQSTITNYFDGIKSNDDLQERLLALSSSWDVGEPTITHLYAENALESGGIHAVVSSPAQKMLVFGTGDGALVYAKEKSGYYEMYRALKIQPDNGITILHNDGPSLLIGTGGKSVWDPGMVHLGTSPVWEKECTIFQKFEVKACPWSFHLHGAMCIVGCSNSIVEFWDIEKKPTLVKRFNYSLGYNIIRTNMTMVYQAPYLWVANDCVTVLAPGSYQEVKNLWDAEITVVRWKEAEEGDLCFPMAIGGKIVVSQRLYEFFQTFDFVDGRITKIANEDKNQSTFYLLTVATAGSNKCKVTGSQGIKDEIVRPREVVIEGRESSYAPLTAMKSELVIYPPTGEPQLFYEHKEEDITAIYHDTCMVASCGAEGNVVVYDYRPGIAGNKKRAEQEVKETNGMAAVWVENDSSGLTKSAAMAFMGMVTTQMNEQMGSQREKRN